MKSGGILFFLVVLLFSAGLLMVFNTTSAELLDKGQEGQIYHALIKQFIASILGALAGLVIYSLGYKKVLSFTPSIFFLGILALILVFLPKVGQEINGSRRWINCFGLSLQPSEFMKAIIPLMVIYRFSIKGIPKTFREFCESQLLYVPPIFLILLEPDNGSALIIVTTLIVLYFLYSVRARYWFLPICAVCLVGGAAAYKMPHVHDRIRVYLHPESDLLGKGHQPYQAKIATGSGGLTGRGFGESMQKQGYLPEARSDYIAAIFAEETGFIGMISLIVLFMAIGGLGFHIACHASDEGGYYTAMILTFLIMIQAFINLGVVSGLLPSKGTNLPFFSQGGSSLIANFINLALLMSISKKEQPCASL
ncbi:MAG: cell division protein FtsW [Chlamydiae bacterium]|nr:cell division protein FtsW [Chlamydiota bacterium]